MGKIILAYIINAVAITFGLGALYFANNPDNIFGQLPFITLLIFTVGIISALGVKHGFDKPLPKEKPIEILIRILNYIFSITLLYISYEILGKEPFKFLLNSVKFLFVIWLWTIFLMVVSCIKDCKKYFTISNKSLPADARTSRG